MKLVFIFLLIFVVHPAVINGERISVIGSQFIPSLSNYKVFLLTNKLKDHSSVDFALLTSDGFVNRTIDINGKDTFDEVEFELPDEHSVSLQLNIESNTGNKCNQQSIKLFNAFDTPKVFIQFDKPIYKTGDEFNFRIFVMDNKLIPILGHPNIDISIIDAKGYTIQKFMDIETSEFGVYENNLRIADAPNLGNWKIQANVMDRTVEKTFGVHQPSVENLEVFIESAPSVAFVDRRMAIGIIVKDNTDKLFIGTASIFVTARFINSDKIEIDHHVKDVDIVGGRKGVTIDIQEDMGIRFPTDHMMLTLTAEVTDQATKRVAKVTKDIELKYGIRNTIQVVRKKYFKPGFKFPTKVKVKLLNGQPDGSFNQLTIINEYHKKNSKIDSKQFKVNLKNGEIPNILQTKADTQKIVVKLEFAGATFEEEILPLPTFGANEYMQIALAKKGTNIGDTIQIQAQTSGEMETLHILVIGQEGIIYTAEYPDAAGLDVYKVPLTLTEKMKPEARVFVFYVHPRDGVIIYDELTLTLGFSIGNSLEISASPSAKPSKSMNVQFKTEQGSKVFLTATDFNTAGINRDNEISRTEVYSELVHYLNLKFSNSSYYHFEKLNTFVVNPLQTGESCENGPAKILTYDSEEEPVSDSNDVKYFPDILFYQHYDSTTSKEQSITLDVPNSLNTWRYFGVSVHPQKGFTVAKVQPKTAVKSGISIKLKAPNSAFMDEILWIDVGVYNSLSQDLQSNVFVSIENGFFVDQRLRSEYNQQCLDFKPKGNKDENFNLRLSGEKLSESKTFLVQSDGNGDMIIKVTATAGSNSDEVTKVIKIENNIQKNLITSQLIELSGPKRSEEINFEDPTGMSMDVYGNLMGPALDGLETMFKHKLTSDEERILKFAAAVTSYKFLELINKLSDEKVKKLENDITTGYQEALAVLDNIIKQNKANSAWLVAMTVQILLDVPKIMTIDPDLIVNSLEFIVRHQQGGKFKYDANFDYRKEMASPNRQDIQAATIISAFFKDDKMKDLYKNEIAITMKYIKSKHLSFQADYPIIIAAYTSALNNDLNDVRTLLGRIRNAYETSEKPQHNAMFVEIVSYKILTKILLKEDPREEVKWLLSKRHADGGWNSPYDTVLALQALYEYAKYKNVQSVGLSNDQTSSSIKNPIESQVTKLRSDKVKFSGKILGYAAFYDEKEEQPTNTSEYFIIIASRVEEDDGQFKIDISLTVNEKAVNNLVVLEVELPRGFRYIQHDQDESVLNVDIRNDRNLVTFYIKKLDINQEIKQTIHAVKIFEVSNHRFSVIKAYDHYRTTVQDTFYYSFDKNEEACERIRVEKEIEKANKSVKTAETAESLTSEARRTIEKAEKDVEDAKSRVKIAEDNVKTAYGAVLETQEVLTNTLSTAEDAVKISNEAENIKAAASFMQKPSIQKSYSPSASRVSNDEEPIVTTTRKPHRPYNSKNRDGYTRITTIQPQTTRTHNNYGFGAGSHLPNTFYQPYSSNTQIYHNNGQSKASSTQRTFWPKTTFSTRPTNQGHYGPYETNQFNDNQHNVNQRAQGTQVQNSNPDWNFPNQYPKATTVTTYNNIKGYFPTRSTYNDVHIFNKRSIQEEESEAIHTQNVAKDAQQKYIEAQQEASLANQELEAANQKLVKAQQEASSARNEASKALNEVKNAQKTAEQAQRITMVAQTATKKVEENNRNTESTANAAKLKFDAAQEKVKQTRQIFDQTQAKVTSTLTLTRTALQNAIKALKGRDVQAEVDKSIEMANDAKDEATKTLASTKDTQARIAAALKDSIDAQNTSESTKSENESVLSQSRVAQKAAKDALDKSNETKDKLEKAREVEEEKEALASVAQNELNEARIKSTNADEKSKQAQAEATRTLQEAKRARIEEVNRAILNAQKVTLEAAAIEEMTALIMSEARKINELRIETINIRKSADLIRQGLPGTQIEFNLIKEDETNKVNNITKLFNVVQNAFKDAKSANDKAKVVAEEASRSSELSQNAKDAVDTTNESSKVLEKLNDIKRLSETVKELKSRTEKDRKLVEKAKLSAEATKRSIDDAKLAYDEEILANSNLIEANNAKILMDNTIQAAKKAVRDAKTQENLNDLINFESLELDMKDALTRASNALNSAKSASKLVSQAAEEARGTDDSTIAMQKADKAQMERKKVQSEQKKTEEERKAAVELQKIVEQVSKAIDHTIQASRHFEETKSEVEHAEEESRLIESVYNETAAAMSAIDGLLKSIKNTKDQSILNIISDVQDMISTHPARTILHDKVKAVSMVILGSRNSETAFTTAKEKALESYKATSEQDAIKLVELIRQQEQIAKSGHKTTQTARNDIIELQKSTNLTGSIAQSLQKTAEAVQRAVQDVIVSSKAATVASQAKTDTKTKYDEVSRLTGDKDKKGAHENRQAELQEEKATKQDQIAHDALKKAVTQLQTAVNAWQAIGDFKDVAKLEEELEKANSASIEAEKEARNVKNARKLAEDAQTAAIHAQNNIQAILKDAVKSRKATEMRNSQNQMKIITEAVPKIKNQAQNVETISMEVKQAYDAIKNTFDELQKSSFKHLIAAEIKKITDIAQQALAELTKAENAETEAQEAKNATELTKSRAEEEFKIVNQSEDIKSVIRAVEGVKIEADNIPIYTKKVEDAKKIVEASKKVVLVLQNDAQEAQQKVRDIEKEAKEAFIKEQRNNIAENVKKATKAAIKATNVNYEAEVIDEESKVALYDAEKATTDIEEAGNTRELKTARDAHQKATDEINKSYNEVTKAQDAARSANDAKVKAAEAHKTATTSTDFNVIKEASIIAENQANEAVKFAQQVEDAKKEIEKIKLEAEKYIKVAVAAKERVETTMAGEIKTKIEEQVRIVSDAAQKASDEAENAERLYKEVEAAYQKVKKIREDIDKMENRQQVDKEFRDAKYAENDAYSAEEEARIENDKAQDAKNKAEMAKELAAGTNSLTKAKEEAENTQKYSKTTEDALRIIKDAKQKVTNAELEADTAWKTALEKENSAKDESN